MRKHIKIVHDETLSNVRFVVKILKENLNINWESILRLFMMRTFQVWYRNQVEIRKSRLDDNARSGFLDLKKVEIRRSGFLDFLKSGRSGSGWDQEIKPPHRPPIWWWWSLKFELQTFVYNIYAKGCRIRFLGSFTLLPKKSIYFVMHILKLCITK